jgi:hypothetical protein
MDFLFKNILGTDKLKLEKYTEYIGNLTKEKVKLEELQKKYPKIAWINQEKENLTAFIRKSNKPQESSLETDSKDVKPTTLDPTTLDPITQDSATPDSATSASKTSASETQDSPHGQTTGGTRKKRKNKKRKKHKKKTFKY